MVFSFLGIFNKFLKSYLNRCFKGLQSGLKWMDEFCPQKGVVQLGGFVNSQQAADKACEITRSVGGIKSVKNNLIVK